MYDYRFDFFKPGKTSYTPQEFMNILGPLEIMGFEIRFPPRDPHVDMKKGTITFQPRETQLGVELLMPGKRLGLFIGPAEGEHGSIGLLAMPEEQFEENPQENTGLLFRTALHISNALKPYFAWGDHELELDKLPHCLSLDRIGALAWANFFSKEFIEEIGGIEKVLFDPEDKQSKKEAQDTLETFSVVPMELAPNPVEPTEPGIILGLESRYPRALFRSFKIPHPSAIEVEP